MKKWSHEEGEEFKNSEACFGREYNPGSGTIDVAKISIRGIYPGEQSWGYLEKSHGMAFVVSGKGFIESKRDGRQDQKRAISYTLNQWSGFGGVGVWI